MVVVSAAAAVAEKGRGALTPRHAAVLAVVLGDIPGAEPWRGEVLRRAAAFQSALLGDDVDASVDAAAALIGLGEGSTPAGDDYLVGVLHGLRFHDESAAHARDDAAAWRRTLEARVAALAPTLTTASSAAWLAAAAHGEASPVWASLLAALASGEEAAVHSAARTVRATGHTSGAFSLRGFLDTLAG